jgi:hypothetical protein
MLSLIWMYVCVVALILILLVSGLTKWVFCFILRVLHLFSLYAFYYGDI